MKPGFAASGRMGASVRAAVFALALLPGGESKAPPRGSSEITAQELREHVRYLSSDELKGRKSGEEGNRLAASYIAACFKEYGLLPPPQTGTNGSPYLQEFSFIISRKPGGNNALSFTREGTRSEAKAGTEFQALSFSADTSVSAPLAFAGYGISSPEILHYDDYKGLDVRGKFVVVMRYSPMGPGENKFTSAMGILEKTMTARDSGAAGIIFLTAPPGSRGSELSTLTGQYPYPAVSIPVLALDWGRMESILSAEGKSLKALQQRIDSAGTPASFTLNGSTASATTEIVKVSGRSANIVGYLPGTSSALAKQVVVLGAHMDHLGMGGEGSGSLKPDTIAIHHGADDNASGTAALLEAAQYFAARRRELKRTVVFAAFSGEELGLLGSAQYVKEPYFPLDSTVAMLNMDMVGRMKDSLLVVEGMGTSPEWEPLARRENRDSLVLKLKPDGFGPSDHSSFYGKNIPVLFFFTNLHSDYHRPSDTWDKINYGGEQKVVEYVVRIASSIVNGDARPAFTKAVSSSQMAGGDRQGVSVSLGVIPDYAEDVHGLKITGTRAGSAAEKAGLKGDDIIIRFDTKIVGNIYDFMHLLADHKPGDEVVVVVKRGTEELSLKAVLEARK
ncbi:MAG TPA: M20/M25/M40 family metallo-hydrolase [Bacteroidota bacterium]|jgi:acetylornithine deacetylase/succinyl-diaminopimelate desuccinylase-like protein